MTMINNLPSPVLTDISFATALSHVKEGNLIARSVWPDEVFVFMRPEDSLPLNILLGAKSLPNKLKDYYELKNQPIIPEDIPSVKVTAYLCMKNTDDSILNGWEASMEDVLATDWYVY